MLDEEPIDKQAQGVGDGGLTKRTGDRRAAQRGRQVRGHDRQPILTRADLHVRGGRVEHGRLDIEDAAHARVPAHQMLRALVHEIPAQVREAHQIKGGRHAVLLLYAVQ